MAISIPTPRIGFSEKKSHRRMYIKLALFTLLFLFLFPSFLYYFYHGGRAESLSGDPEYMGTINNLSNRYHLPNQKNVSAVEPTRDTLTENHSFFQQIYVNFVFFIKIVMQTVTTK